MDISDILILKMTVNTCVLQCVNGHLPILYIESSGFDI